MKEKSLSSVKPVICIKKPNLNQHIESVHEVKNLVKLKNFAQDMGLNKHIVTINPISHDSGSY